MSWNDLDTGFKALFGLIGTLLVLLGAGKAWRTNRADSAATTTAISGSQSENAANLSVTSELKRLSALVNEQGTKIDSLREEVAQLKTELGDVHNNRRTALKLLRKINLCTTCDSAIGVLLETAIDTLHIEDEEHTDVGAL
jgi:TolA-binding protein